MANNLPKPRPVDFVLNGFTVKEMNEILARWETICDLELIELGFLRIDHRPKVLKLIPGGKP